MFFVSSCEKSGEANITPHNTITLSDGLSITNGVLKFKDKAAYLSAQEKMQNDIQFLISFDQKLKANGFKSIGSLYSNFDKKQIENILISNQVPQNLSKYYRILQEDAENYELVESIKGNWLRTILNENLTFSIEETDFVFDYDKVTLKENIENSSPKILSYSFNKDKNLRSINSSNDTDYSHDGRNYRIKIKIDTGSRIYLPTWGLWIYSGQSDIECKHQRRTLWTWWQYDTAELSISGSSDSWLPDANGNWDFRYMPIYSGIQYNTSCVSQITVNARTINAEGKAKCVDGQTRTVSTNDAA